MDTNYIRKNCCDIEKFIQKNNLDKLRKTNDKLLYKKVLCEFKDFNKHYPKTFNNVIKGNYEHIEKLVKLIDRFK
jgi:hypothetical protein